MESSFIKHISKVVDKMMISPESYYEVHLKGKSEKEILSAIRGLKNEIGHLKNVMEHPDYGSQGIIHPSEDVQLWCNRLYLEKAKETLSEIGGTYTPSQAEIKAQIFQDNIEYISKVRFEIGGFFSGYRTYTITIDDKHIHYDTQHSLMLKPDNLTDTMDYPMERQNFLDGIRELYIGEWRHNYCPERFGYTVLDGTQWNLEIEYSNGTKKLTYGGSNSYPYNFVKLKELFGIEEDMDEE